MVSVTDAAISIVGLDKYRAGTRCPIEKKIAAIFDAEVHKAAQEVSNIISGQCEGGKRGASRRF